MEPKRKYGMITFCSSPKSYPNFNEIYKEAIEFAEKDDNITSQRYKKGDSVASILIRLLITKYVIEKREEKTS